MYPIEEQLNIVAAMEEISPVGAKTEKDEGLEEDELDVESLSMVTAARSLSYQSFLKRAKEHPVF